MAITDLTGCVWVSTTDSLSETLNASYNNPYLINFTYNNDTYDSMFEDAGYRLAFSKNNVAIFVYNWDEGFWEDTPPITLTFTGGTDATNSTLIQWLQDNGTLTAPQPTANTYTITHTLTNVNKGNITLQLTPDTGYELPDTISVSNGTLVSYDKTTGIAVISGDDNTSVSVECVASAPSGYNLTINYTGNMNPALRVYVNKTPASFDSTDYDYEFYYENSPCIVSGLVANDYVYLLGQYGGRYDWTASSNVNCTYVDEEYGRFKVVISSDANASIDINFED